jgi:predicted amidohydrolase
MASTTLRIALIQQDTLWQNPAANLARAREYVSQAARVGARVAVFPELFTLGFTMAPEPFAEALPGPTTEVLSALSREFNLYLVGSAVEAHTPHPRNAAFVTAPDGSLQATYRKLHPFSYGEENRHYSGGEDCPVFEIDGIPCGLQICYDLRFPEPFRLAAEGTDLFAVVANWPERRRAHWQLLLKARAVENLCYVAGVNRVGEDGKGNRHMGDSSVTSPWGETLVSAAETETVLIADIDPTVVADARAKFPVLKDRRPAYT